MDQRLAKLQHRTGDIIAQSTRPDKARVLAALLKTWEELQEEGVAAFDFSHVAVLVAETVVQTYDNLDELESFGRHLEERGVSIVRCVRNHWPLVDSSQWPEGAPDWLTRNF